MQFYKKLIFKISGTTSLLISKFIPPISLTSVSQATKIIQEKYTPSTMWTSLEVLESSTIDISIIIPVYNRERFLKKCLYSIFNQKTKYKYEVICINDGSTDNSLEILRSFQIEYPDKLVIINQDNQGASAARNHGIEIAKGEYLGFIDSDDYVAEDYIDKIISKAKESNADIIQVGYSRITPSGKVLANITHESVSINGTNKTELFKKVSGFVGGGTIRKELFRQLRYPVGFWYEDIITRLLLMRICKRFEYIGESLYHYVIHKENFSKTIQRGNTKSMDQLYLAKYLADYSIHTMGLPKDEILYGVLTYELGTVLWLRIRKLPAKLQKAAFTIAADYMNSIRPTHPTWYESFYRDYDKAFRKMNFGRWWFLSLSVMLRVKLRNG